MTELPFAELVSSSELRRRPLPAAGGVTAPRVAVVSPLDIAGGTVVGDRSRWSVNLARELNRVRGPKNALLVSVGGPGTALADEDVALQVLTPSRPGSLDDAPLDALSWELSDAIGGVDAVVACEPFTRGGEVACLVASALARPTVAVDLGGRSSRVGSSLGLLGLVDRVVSCTRFGARLLPGGVSPMVLPGGVDDRFFAPGPSRTERGHVLLAGALTSQTGIDRVLAAMPQLPLVVCGPAPDPGYLEALRSLAAGRDVRFEVAVGDEDLRQLYRCAWCTVVAPRSADRRGSVAGPGEIVGLAAQESMACGTPVVAQDVGGLSEIVGDGTTGYVCTTDADIAARAAALAANPVLVEQLALGARRTVEERFAMRHVAEAIGTVLAALVDRQRSRAS